MKTLIVYSVREALLSRARLGTFESVVANFILFVTGTTSTFALAVERYDDADQKVVGG